METLSIIDWISGTRRGFVSSGMGVEGLKRVIKNDFMPELAQTKWTERHGHNGYTIALESSIGVIAQVNPDRPDMGLQVTMSGGTLKRGLGIFIRPVNILQWMLNNGYRLSRLDLAIDAYDSKLSIGTLAKMVIKKQHKTLARTAPYIADGMRPGKTQYIGSMKARKKLFRAYDKGVQMNLENADWKRFELELHGHSANQARHQIIATESMPKTIQSLIVGFIDFPEYKKWMSIMGTDAVKMGNPMDKESDTRKWLLTQVAPSLARVLDEDEGFMYKFMEAVGENRE